MCDKAVDDCLEALKFISDWFVTSKMPEKFDNALHANDDIVFCNEVLIKSQLLLIKDICILQILIKSILITIMIFMEMILTVLFMPDFWFGVATLKNVKHYKKDE